MSSWPELRFVQVAGGEPVRLKDRLAVEREPRPVIRPGHVGDDKVRVQVRLLRPTRPVPESGDDEAPTVLPHPSTLATADDAGLLLEVAKRRLP